MRTIIQTITPEQASAWLHPSINRENRAVRQDHVAYLAKEMIDGRWQLTHQGIAFCTDGGLLDGQHRLHAIVRAGVSVQMQVTTGMERDTFAAMDCGAKRANYDRIHLVDDQNQNKIICQGLREYLARTSKDSTPSVGELEDEFLSKADAWVWVGREFDGINGRLRKAGIVAAMAIYRFINAAKADEFMAGYRDGAGLPLGSPVLKLRNDAMTGGARDVGYWRCVSILRAHLKGQPAERVFEATEDMMGNKNGSRAISERSEVRRRAAATRWGKAKP